MELELARDELRELDRAKSRFTANIHHELRTPLTLVLAPLEAMLQGEFGEVSEAARQYLRTMQVNALRLLKLINNLLDLAKAESGILSLKRRPTDVGRMAADVVSGARPMAERKGIRLETRGLEGLPVLHADPDALEKIVMNLLGNALKFTDAGGTIAIRAETTQGGIRLTVADTGIGIPADQLARVFDRFAQVDASATRKHEGTGIGLSLVKELVELHGGRVWAESQGLGRGSQFHVLIPPGTPGQDETLAEEVIQNADGTGVALGRSLGALEAELNLEAQGGGLAREYRHAEIGRTVERFEGANAPSGTGPGSLASPLSPDAPEILVTEDNAEMRRLLVLLLSREFRVREARHGREALEKVRERAPDLVLTDVMMPEMSGTELCRALKTDPATQSIPVVLVTSKAEREMKVEGLELGADDYVTKPFHPRELLARVRGLVRVRRLQTELADRNAELEGTNQDLAQALSELKAAEVQLVRSERLAAVGELAAGVAHEVNNPVNFAGNALTMIRGHVESLKRLGDAVAGLDLRDAAKIASQAGELERLRDELGLEELTRELDELLGIAGEGLGRTQRLVGDLRDFAGAPLRQPVPVDVGRGLLSTVQLVSHSLDRARIRLETRIEPDLPRVRGDGAALNQVFLNLLKNAADALETSGGRIEVEARRSPEGRDVVVMVRDDGPGVPAEMQTRLFEPFVSSKEAGRGSGLGLSICQRIVSEHGGTIELDRGAARGACFVVRLPGEGMRAA